MADRDATWRLTLTRDPGAKAEARAFAKEVVDENQKMQSTLLRNTQDLERKKTEIQRKELAARTAAERLAMQQTEQAHRASLAKQVAATRLARIEEARINSAGGGIVPMGGLGTAPRSMARAEISEVARRNAAARGAAAGNLGTSAFYESGLSTGSVTGDVLVGGAIAKGIGAGISRIPPSAWTSIGGLLKTPIGLIVAGAAAAAVGSYELISGGGKFKAGSYGSMVGQGLLKANRFVAGAYDSATGGNTRKETDLGKLEQSAERLTRHEAKSVQYRQMMAAHDERINSLMEARKKYNEQSQKAEDSMLKAGRERIKQQQEMLKARAENLRAIVKESQADLATARDRLAIEKQTLSAAVQRFGAMDKASQNDVLAAVKKARAGGKLSADEIGSISALGTKEADKIVQQYNARNAGGDRSNELAQLSAISMQRRNLLAERAKIERDAPDDYDAQGNIVGKLVGRKRSQQYSAIDERVKQLNDIETRIRTTVDADSALRRSLFAGERSDIAQAGRQATTIQARVNHQISVVNKFEFSAKQIAEQATKQMIESMRPFMAEVDREMRRMGKELEKLVQTRRQTVSGGV